MKAAASSVANLEDHDETVRDYQYSDGMALTELLEEARAIIQVLHCLGGIHF